MTTLPKIADAELEVMRVLWDRSPLTANEIVEVLEKRKPWDPRTVKTLINRLHNKGAIGFDKEGRRYLYYPLVSSNDCIKNETKSFIAKFKNGMMKPVVAAFLEEVSLSRSELEELKQMLEDKEKG